TPCGDPHGAGVFADAVSRTDSGGLGGAPWGRADYPGHLSPLGRGQAGRHNLPPGLFYYAHVRRHAGHDYFIGDPNAEDRRSAIEVSPVLPTPLRVRSVQFT